MRPFILFAVLTSLAACSVSDRASKNVESSSFVAPAPFKELDNQKICNNAIKYKIVDHRVSPIWDAARDGYVVEAKGRGFTPEICSIEVSTDTSNSGRLTSLPRDTLCGVAFKRGQWNMSDYARGYVSDAKRRGLTPLECGKLIGRLDQEKLKKVSDQQLCQAALHKHPTAVAFSTSRSKRDIIAEAKSRNLTPERCRALLG